jgi:hypothetical protein
LTIWLLLAAAAAAAQQTEPETAVEVLAGIVL